MVNFGVRRERWNVCVVFLNRRMLIAMAISLQQASN